MVDGATAAHPRTVGLLLGIIGSATMFVASVTLFALIPVWFPNDDDERGPALAGFAALSVVCGLAGWVGATRTGASFAPWRSGCCSDISPGCPF